MAGAAPSQAVAEWIKGARRNQPPKTLAIFAYVKDGLVNVAVPIDRNHFPVDDLIVVRDIVSKLLTQAFEDGPTNGR